MYVKDYDFICDINVLFERRIIIYGAGYFGKRVANLLDDISVKFDCFCDENITGEYLGHAVITMEELKRITDGVKCLVIVASSDYCAEIVEELQKNQIEAYVCSWYGIQTGIELNISDKRLPKEFAEDFIQRKEIWQAYHKYLFNTLRWLCAHPDAILIYQPGKVGSRSIQRTLEKEKIDSLHVHMMRHEINLSDAGWENVEVSDAGVAYLISKIRAKEKVQKIIVSVREPIARAIAAFMEGFTYDFVIGCDNGREFEKDSYESIIKEIKEQYELGWWFDHELKAVTGIDVYEYPFDRERGYAWIKTEGIEILLLKMEQMNENVDVIGEFVGRPGLAFVNSNLGSKKTYQYIYEEMKKRIRIPEEIIEEQYQSPRFLHFYTEQEGEKFKKKWIR